MARELVKIIDSTLDPVENLLMNGGFHNWQKGNGVAGADVFGADRWLSTEQTTLVEKAIATDPFTNKEINYARVHKTGVVGPASGVRQPIESSVSSKMVGKICTIHFYMRKEAGSVNDFQPYILITTPGAKDDWTLTATTQESALVNFTVTTDFNIFTYSFVAGADFELGASVYLTGYSATVTDTDQFIVGLGQTMLHISGGSGEYIPWIPAGGSIAQENSLVKRYFEAVPAGSMVWHPDGSNLTRGAFDYQFEVEKRITPAIEGTINVGHINGPTGADISSATISTKGVSNGIVTAGLTQDFIYTNSAAAWFNAELI